MKLFLVGFDNTLKIVKKFIMKHYADIQFGMYSTMLDVRELTEQIRYAEKEYDGILFTCASSAKRLLAAYGTDKIEDAAIYSIGPKTTECLKKQGILKVLEAEESTYEKLAKLCVQTG